MAGVDKLAKLAGLTKEQVSNIFDAVLNLARVGDRVVIRDFGSFYIQNQTERWVISSAMPGGKALIPEAKILRFKPAKEARQLVKKKGKATTKIVD